MSGSTQRKLRSKIICERSLDNVSEGSSARTRPLTYDEIMLKRRSKKELEGFVEEAHEAETTRREENVRYPDRQSRDVNGSAKKISREHQRESSPRKVEKSSRDERTHSKSDKKERRDGENRLKHKHDNDVKNASEFKSDRQARVSSKEEEDPRGESGYNHDKKHRDPAAHDKYVERNDRQARVSSKAEEHPRGESGYNHDKKHRDPAAHDRYVERNGRAFERENKRRDRSGDDEKHRLRDPVKKHDSGGSRWDSEISERKDKTEPSRSRHDETRSKRRRSRSQERTKEKARKSRSSSPKAPKSALDHAHDHVEPSSRSERESSRRQSDVDRSMMSTDGSSSHHRRHGVSSSGLGGYSPRKRKSEAAVKTPSPIRSPERNSAGWDLQPSTADRNLSTTAPSGTQLVTQPKPSNMIELKAGVSVASIMGKPIPAILSNSLSAFKQASIDSVQLTQATRPMRRLYIDNIPGSATEKDIMECFNTFLLSSGSNYIRGAHPCISCMIHKEKGQALVEFLTPEDASAALSFDGRSLSGSILKIRRPKDFVEVPIKSSGSSEKSKPVEETISEISISDFVKDSPHKIFVCGIAEGLSSEMLMEIVSAFGTLKAYRFEVNEDLKEPCAFLEYADQSVTLKACAGLNGMKLGGRVLTVAQALPITESESCGSHPFYGIPEHVKPLLEKPTEILKLKNVLNEKALDLLSETELEELVEDVRLECSRFGSVVSMNVVKGGKTHTSISEAKDVIYDIQVTHSPEERNHHLDVNPIEVAVDHDEEDGNNGESLCTIKEFDTVIAVEDDKLELAPATPNTEIEAGAAGTSIVGDPKGTDKTSHRICDNKADNGSQETAALGVSTTDDMGIENEHEGNHQEASIQESGVSSELNSNQRLDIEKSDKVERRAEDVELGKNDMSLEVVHLLRNSGATEKGANMDNSCDTKENVFEVGCVLVEFRRVEASCRAAHCLHGRAFDDRIVTVEYVPLKAYRERFLK